MYKLGGVKHLLTGLKEASRGSQSLLPYVPDAKVNRVCEFHRGVNSKLVCFVCLSEFWLIF